MRDTMICDLPKHGKVQPNYPDLVGLPLDLDHHPHSGPWHGEMVYLALSDNIDHSADSAGPYNQRDPLSKLGLIRHHQEHRVFVISCDPPHLHMQDDKPEQASVSHPTAQGSTGSPRGLPKAGWETHTAAPKQV